jgi:outer membrane protein OmpA-like peptidoglycan-associated protein
VQLIDEATGKVVDEATNNNTNTVTFRLERGKKYSLKAIKKNYADGTGKSSAMDLPIDRSVSLTAKLMLDPRKTVTVRTFDGRDKTKLNGCTVTLYDASGKEISAKTDNNTNEFTFDLLAGQSYKAVGTKNAFIPDDESFAANDVNGKYVDLMLGLPMFDTIYFDFDKDKIRPDGALKLDKAAAVLAQFPQLFIEIGGHTDGFGDNAYNDDLGKRRATNAMKYLIGKNVAEDRMARRTFGEAQLWKNEKTAKGGDDPNARGYNRRAVIKIINVDELQKLREAEAPKQSENMKPAAKPVEKPAEKVKPAEKPAEKTKPADKPAAKPAEKPATEKTKPAEKATPAKVGKEEANAGEQDDKKKG